ncbi:His Kinase A (phospho-acceptor) domain-containing protein [Bryocella elongata]|uniref:histidine kinase n=1 Tax=Bryocella elongata TaxID=863522 RepID=A0A1H6BKE6_9BACT|nr:sensor histidine kinase [Bryocella elongata]SEG61188.1 His Kinase A (phospho-acceptor) domain-containing protein [Bryocella elongata]
MRTGKYRLAMAAAMLIVAFNAWLAIRALHAFFDVQNWRAHTFEVLVHTKTVEADVSKSTAAVRAYLISGDPLYKSRYNDATADIDRELDAIKTLTVDNNTQQERLAYTRQRILVRMSALQTGIAMRDATHEMLGPVSLMAVLTDSPDHGPTVAYCLQQMENEENRLLNDRTAASLRARSVVVWTFVAASLLAILLLGATAELGIRAVRDRQALINSEAEIRVLNEELRITNTSLEERVEQRTKELANTNQELEAFSYSVSHDLRAPLRTIDGFSLALSEDYADKLDETGRDYITRVRGGVQRMGLLIDSLLQLSRVTRMDLQSERFDISQVASLVFGELEALDKDRSVELVAQPGVLVVGDPRLIRIALENLMGNAWKFTSKTPNALIQFGSMPGTGEYEGTTVYFVRDNGAGFDMQYVDRLFTAFQRLHGDRDFKGSGIGLATVSRIIRRHHGSIWAEGQIGQGATFYFTLGGPGADVNARA